MPYFLGVNVGRCVVCGEKGLGEVEEEEERDLILRGVGNLVMENFHGNGCKEWKKKSMYLCV